MIVHDSESEPESVRESGSEDVSMESIASDVESDSILQDLGAFHKGLCFGSDTHDIGVVEASDLDDAALASWFSAGLSLMLLRIIMAVRHVVVVRSLVSGVSTHACLRACRAFIFWSFLLEKQPSADRLLISNFVPVPSILSTTSVLIWLPTLASLWHSHFFCV